MSDTDSLTDLEIFACTLIGESEELGEEGMTGTACTIMNRAAANLPWMGGSNVRNVCLRKSQYDCWWPQTGNADRTRILDVANLNPLYGPYVLAQRISGDALAGRLADTTNGAVSYGDGGEVPYGCEGKTPCLVVGSRQYFDLAAVK